MVASGVIVGTSKRAYSRAGSVPGASSGSSDGAIAPAKRPPSASSAACTRGFVKCSRSSATLASTGSVLGRRTITSRTSCPAASSRAMLSCLYSISLIPRDPRAALRPLDDHGRGLDDRRRAHAGLEPELIRALPRHQRDDPLAPARDLDLSHDLVALDGDDRAGEPVARARARRPGALGQQAGELAGGHEALVAAALEADA